MPRVRNERKRKYHPGYEQGQLRIQGIVRPLIYAVWCYACENYSEVSSTMLSRGIQTCGCNHTSRVYFIRARINDEFDFMKIGRSTENNTVMRFAVAQTHFPFDLVLERTIDGPRNLESIVHLYFDAARINSKREWFWFTPRMLTVTFEELMEGNSIETSIFDPSELGF